MTDKEQKIFAAIKRQLNKHLEKCSFVVNRSKWYSGITNDTRRRCRQHDEDKNFICFKCWNAETFTVAHKLEEYCSEKGFINSGIIGGAKKTSIFFYVFKTNLDLGDSVVSIFERYNDTNPINIRIRKTISKTVRNQKTKSKSKPKKTNIKAKIKSIKTTKKKIQK